jgi:hypothetical protein
MKALRSLEIPSLSCCELDRLQKNGGLSRERSAHEENVIVNAHLSITLLTIKFNGCTN